MLDHGGVSKIVCLTVPNGAAARAAVCGGRAVVCWNAAVGDRDACGAVLGNLTI